MTRLTRMGELFRVGSSKRVLKSQWRSEGVPFYRGREITRLATDGCVHNELFISESLYEELSGQYGVPDAGDIMVTAIGTIGNSYVVRSGERFYFKDASVLWLKKTAEVLSEFVNYWLKSDQFFEQLDRGNGATVDTLTIQKMQSVCIHIPPLATQRRIVAILDEAFEGIATAKANAEKNLRNARELFDSHVCRVFSATDDRVSLDELASDITDGDHMPPPKAPTGIPFITISNIDKRTRTIDFEDTFLVSPEYFSSLKPNRKPRRGDVLYTVTGATLGIPVLVDHDAEFCFQRHIALIRPRPGTNSAWLNYLMSSPQVFAQATAGATGAAQKTVSLTLLRSIKVPRHSEAAQVNIAAQLDELFAHAYKLEDLYRARLSALGELKKSILHQAFSGAV